MSNIGIGWLMRWQGKRMFFQLKLKFLLRKTSDCAKCNLQIYIIITEHDVISINQREKASILLCSQLPSISRYQEFVKDFNHLQNKGSQKSVCRVVITSGVCVLLTLESYTWTSLFSWMLWSKMSYVKKNLTEHISQYWTKTSQGYFCRKCVCMYACEHLCNTTLSFAVFNLPLCVYKM